MLIIKIPELAVGKQRPKFSSRNNYVVAYTPSKTKKYENTLRSYMTNVMQVRDIYKKAIDVEINIEIIPPKTKINTKKSKELFLMGELYPTVKPDIDNYAKAILDAMNGIVFRDDAQIINLNITKRYSQTNNIIVKVCNHETPY